MKPRVLVLGGCGFIGRNVVSHLVREDVAGEVCVVDKVPPQTAWLNSLHKESFNDPRVTFTSANLINPDSCRTAFMRADDNKWDWVINCAGETRLGQAHAVYEQGVVTLSHNCAQQAAHAQVNAYIEISCCMSSNRKISSKESDVREPVSRLSKYKSQVEDALSKIANLKCFIVRPGIVYGCGDRSGLMPLMIMGAVYQLLGESMKMLWSRDVKSHTVHVHDLVRAIVHLLSRDAFPESDLEVFHVVDDNDSTQGSLCQLVSQIFRIDHSFYGTAISTITKGDLEHVAEECNDKHLGPWAVLCSAEGVTNTPLTPYLTADNLIKSHINLDGAKLRNTGFTYTHPKLKKEYLIEIIEEYIAMHLFPKPRISLS